MDPLGWINTHDDWTLRQKQTHFYILFSTRQLSVYRLKSRQMSPSWNAFSKPKKTVASGILWIKIKRRILTFSTGRQKGINGVLYESRTGMSWAVATRAHVSTVKFTSGSRPRSSRPRILRSLYSRYDLYFRSGLWKFDETLHFKINDFRVTLTGRRYLKDDAISSIVKFHGRNIP